MLNYNIIIKNTKELNTTEFNHIIKLKQQYWDYDYDSQAAWFKKNIFDDDIHFLLYDNGELIGYLNAVRVNVKLNDQVIQALGIGNVCVDRSCRNRGLGKILIEIINLFLKNIHYCGFLLCKDNLVDFYRGCNWRVIDATKVYTAGNEFIYHVMSYNLLFNYGKIDKIEFSRIF